MPYLTGRADPAHARPYCFCERVPANPQHMRQSHADAKGPFMVRGQGWKYFRYPNGDEYLYHLSADPGETKNRAADPACQARKRAMTEAWKALLSKGRYGNNIQEEMQMMIGENVRRQVAIAAAFCGAWTILPMTLAGAGDAQPPVAAATEPWDLSGPEYNPPDCPAWAKEKLPAWVKPYVGVNGLPKKWWPPGKARFISPGVKGLDRYQANQFIFYCPQTADYLYGEYTPLKVGYRRGTLPGYEKVSARYTAGCRTDTEKAVALLKGMGDFLPHPVVPPCGK